MRSGSESASAVAESIEKLYEPLSYAFVVGREVPLADGERRVPLAHEHLGEEPVGRRHRRVVAREAGRELDDPGHPAGVVVAAGEQAGARRRAQRGGVEAVELEAVLRQPLGDRSVDRAAERARGREPDVVEQDDEHVRRAGRGPQRLDRRERRLRILGVQRELALVWPIRDRQNVA